MLVFKLGLVNFGETLSTESLLFAIQL